MLVIKYNIVILKEKENDIPKLTTILKVFNIFSRINGNIHARHNYL